MGDCTTIKYLGQNKYTLLTDEMRQKRRNIEYNKRREQNKHENWHCEEYKQQQ